MSSSRIRTYLQDEIAECTTPPIQATFLNDSGVAQQPVSATLTLHYQGTIINNRDATNILGSITSGVLNFGTEVADFAMQQTVEESEVHVALIEWTWLDTAGRTRSDKHEIRHTVRNLLQVP
jgi:hypothetical protein